MANVQGLLNAVNSETDLKQDGMDEMQTNDRDKISVESDELGHADAERHEINTSEVKDAKEQDTTQQDSKQHAEVKEELEEGTVRLSDSILMYSNKPLCSSAHVYRGLLISGVYGNVEIAVKYLQYKALHVREAEILQGMGSHPNVVTFHSADIYSKGPYPALYIAMELCQTLNLHDRIVQDKKDNVPFDPDQAITHSKQVALGVDFIHENQICYRDLKPQNVLISLDGKNLKIADFGLSKPIRKGRSITKQSIRGAGTDGYRAPETYNNDVISQLSDIFSLALVFFFIWSYGCHPYGDDYDDWNSNIKKNRNRDLSQLKIADKESAKNLLTWMLQFRPRERPTTKKVLEHCVFTGTTSAQGPYALNPETEAATQEVATMNLEENLEVILEEVPSTSREDPPPRIIKVAPIKSRKQEAWKPAATSVKPAEVRSSDANTSLVEVKKHAKPENMDDRESLEAILEEENCQTLMRESKYANALLKLNDLVAHGRNEISTQLMIMECNLQVGRVERAKQIIADMKEKILTSPPHIVHEIKAMMDDNIQKGFHICGIVLIQCWGWLRARNTSPIVALESLQQCMSKADDVLTDMSKKGGRSLMFAYSIGYPAMLEMFEELRGISGVYPDIKLVSEARCLNYIGNSYFEMHDFQDALKYRQMGIDLLVENFGENAKLYQVYGSLLNNAAVAMHHLGNFMEAHSLYMRSIESESEAIDFNSEADRQRVIEEIRVNMIKNRSNFM